VKGTVKWFNSSKGYGFITGEDGKDVYVNTDDILSGTQINDGDNVKYTVQETEKGLRAQQVEKQT
jgi:CspA family cold shock protein